MKKILGLIFALAVVSSVSAAAFTATAGYNIEWQKYNHVVTPIASDSLIDPDDTIAVCTKTPFESGWIYLLKWGTMTGTGSDSIDIDIAVKTYDKNDSLLSTTAVETITAVTSRNVALPIHRTDFGAKFTILMSSSAAAGYQILIPTISIDRVRYVGVNRDLR